MKLNKKIKRIIPMAIGLLLSPLLLGQTLSSLSLSEAYTLLEKNYPALQNNAILDQIYQKELEQLDKQKLPSLYLKGDGRLQSQAMKLEPDEGVMVPFEIDQSIISVKAYAEAKYLILDGGINEAQRKQKAAQLKADHQSIEVDRYALRERINQLFIGILLLREQSKLLPISKADLQARKEKVTAGVEYGILLESELIKLEVKELELKAQEDNLVHQISGLVNTLGELTGTTISENVNLEFPDLISPKTIPALNRPEQQYFQAQRASIIAKTNLIEADRRPKLSAYAQVGLGYPNPLNILDNNLAPFGVLGAQFSWKITDWKKGALNTELLSLQAMKVNKAEETFEFDMNSKVATYQAEVDRLLSQIEQDKKIADLQAKILNQLSVQLDEGVITASDYILQVNAELLARQYIVIHETELLKAQLNFLNERGH